MPSEQPGIDNPTDDQPIQEPNTHQGVNTGFDGLLIIGDPHIEGRQPNFRKDNYPEKILDKLEFCLEHCRKHNLQPVCLGDLFDKPRDNPTWIIGRLIDMLSRTPMIGIYGNHDCRDPELNKHDTLSLLIKSGGYRLVSASDFWTGSVGGRRLVVAGSSYRHPIPIEFETRMVPTLKGDATPPLVLWLTHHDIDFAGYESGRYPAHEITNVDLLINGHIHRRCKPMVAGKTTWINPGNISRRSRSEANKTQTPTAFSVKVIGQKIKVDEVEIPHEPFEAVFHESAAIAELESSASGFVSGMKELLQRRTDSGAGLKEFIEHNIGQFESDVADQINQLVLEVTQDGDSGKLASASTRGGSADG